MDSVIDKGGQIPVPTDRWSDVIERYHARAVTQNGVSDSGGGRISNEDAIALIEMMRRAARDAGVAWPSWYQLAAIAYGYSGPGDTFDDSPARMVMPYDESVSVYLWEWLIELAEELDKRPGLLVLATTPKPDQWYAMKADTEASIAADGGECRVPLPGVPPDQWPKCPDKDRLPKPPLTPNPLDGAKRLVVIAVIVLVAWKLLTED